MVVGRQELNAAFPLQVTAHQPLVFLATSWTLTTANNENQPRESRGEKVTSMDN